MRKRNLRHVLLVFCLALLAFNSVAQIDKDKKCGLFKNFHSINSVSILKGSTTTSLMLNSINGFQRKNFFAGIGTGIDFYYHTSIPLFLDIRYRLLNKKNIFELVANGGVHIPFSLQNPHWESSKGEYKAGSLFETGIDYRVPLEQGDLLIGAAYSYKQVINMVENNVWNPVLDRVDNLPIKHDYRFRRIAFKVGWVF